ncbi:unnamed protein product [Acanthocheilonema viteae]|uniref:Uncharacterized protein n=1 Tax=Acanthocheilonema viteae TaxID=6277 RepID=A0A498SRT3_ACAVI|nr:unnamed protein product [Acanthocheilonema viteae]
MLLQVYKSYRVLNTVTGPDYKFFECFCSPLPCGNKILVKKLEIIIRNVFPHVTNFTIRAGLFSTVLQYTDKFESTLLMPKLRFLHVVIGDRYGSLTNNHVFTNFILARRFASGLKSVELSVTLSPDSDQLIACCSFRKLIRFLMEIAEKDCMIYNHLPCGLYVLKIKSNDHKDGLTRQDYRLIELSPS